MSNVSDIVDDGSPRGYREKERLFKQKCHENAFYKGKSINDLSFDEFVNFIDINKYIDVDPRIEDLVIQAAWNTVRINSTRNPAENYCQVFYGLIRNIQKYVSENSSKHIFRLIVVNDYLVDYTFYIFHYDENDKGIWATSYKYDAYFEFGMDLKAQAIFYTPLTEQEQEAYKYVCRLKEFDSYDPEIDIN